MYIFVNAHNFAYCAVQFNSYSFTLVACTFRARNVGSSYTICTECNSPNPMNFNDKLIASIDFLTGNLMSIKTGCLNDRTTRAILNISTAVWYQYVSLARYRLRVDRRPYGVNKLKLASCLFFFFCSSHDARCMRVCMHSDTGYRASEFMHFLFDVEYTVRIRINRIHSFTHSFIGAQINWTKKKMKS